MEISDYSNEFAVNVQEFPRNEQSKTEEVFLRTPVGSPSISYRSALKIVGTIHTNLQVTVLKRRGFPTYKCSPCALKCDNYCVTQSCKNGI